MSTSTSSCSSGLSALCILSDAVTATGGTPSSLPSLAPPATTYTTVSTNDIGDVFSGIVVSSNGQTSWQSSTQVSTHVSSTPVTLTMTTQSWDAVIAVSCGGVEVSGSASCTESWEPVSTITKGPSGQDAERSCAAWYPGPSEWVTSGVSKGWAGQRVKCVTPVSGAETKALPTPWDYVNQEHNWFRSTDDWSSDFCNRLAERKIVIRKGDPGGDTSPGECSTYQGLRGYTLSFAEYGITVGVAYDELGCTSDDKREDGIDMAQYGADNCQKGFSDLMSVCVIQDDGRKNMQIGVFNAIGGSVFRDCMRFTVAANRKDLRPPDTQQNNGVEPPPNAPTTCSSEENFPFTFCQGPMLSSTASAN